MGIFNWNRKKFKGTVNIDGRNLSAEGEAVPNSDGTYNLIGTTGSVAEIKTPTYIQPRHGGCDEGTLHRMEKSINALV